jgi:hypothetical protein
MVGSWHFAFTYHHRITITTTVNATTSIIKPSSPINAHPTFITIYTTTHHRHLVHLHHHHFL